MASRLNHDPETLAIYREHSSRECDAIRLFRPQPHQLGIFTSTATELLIVGGSRAGKTMCTVMEICSAATGIPITGPDGRELPFKYHRHRPLTIWCIGLGEKHIKQTIHRFLLESTPELMMLRDEGTGQWRAFNPLKDGPIDDLARTGKAVMMPPILPPRMIQDVVYLKGKKSRLIERIELYPRPEFPPGSRGTCFYCYSSIGEVKKGDPVDIIWVDEHIDISDYYVEWLVRLSDRNGRLFWPITPDRRRNAALDDLNKHAKLQIGRPNPTVQKIVLTFSDNAFIAKDRKANLKERLSETDWANRDYGEMLAGGALIYPDFSQNHHGTPCLDEKDDDKIDAKLRENGLRIPDDWTRELVVDPGFSHPGALFCAVPPPELGQAGIVYDDHYVPNANVDVFVKSLAEKCHGQHFYRFHMDSHFGNQTNYKDGRKAYEIYASSFREHGIKCEVTGSNFILASDELVGDISLVREKMRRDNGRPWLRFVRDRCYNFVRMVESYEREQFKDKRSAQWYVADRPAKKQIDPLCDCLRYWVASVPQYHLPPQAKAKASGAYELWKQLEEADEQTRLNQPVCLGIGLAKKPYERVA